MNESKLCTIAQLRAFLEGTSEVQFRSIDEDPERYAFISSVIKRIGYARHARPDKGVVLRFLACITGYSRAQLRRLVRRVLAGEVVLSSNMIDAFTPLLDSSSSAFLRAEGDRE